MNHSQSLSFFFCGRIVAILLLAIFLIAGQQMQAQIWNNQSVTLLRGDDYAVGNAERMVVTFEHASGWSWGTLFLFVDRHMDQSGLDYLGTYGECHPTFIVKSFPKSSWLKAVVLAGTLEKGNGDIERYLLGPGLQLSCKGFDRLQVSLQYRNDRFVPSDTLQLTVTWAMTFHLNKTRWLFDGFADWAGVEGPKGANLNVTPQVKLDLGHLWNRPSRLYFGTEYNYWENKFGIPGRSERNWNWLLKYHWTF